MIHQYGWKEIQIEERKKERKGQEG